MLPRSVSSSILATVYVFSHDVIDSVRSIRAYNNVKVLTEFSEVTEVLSGN